MKRSTTFLLAGMTVLGLVSCKPAPRTDGTTTGTGSETGSMSAPADTTTTGAGMTNDTGRTGLDTTAKQ